MGILSSLLDPIFGADTKSTDAKAQDYLGQATNAFNNINTPNLVAPNYQSFQDLGNYNPASYLQAQSVAPSQVTSNAMAGIQTNPAFQNQQLASLGALQDIAARGGLSDADRANLAQINSQAAQNAHGMNDAVMQAMQARGMGGSGQDLLARLQNNQAATNQANQNGLTIAGQAQNNALGALMQGGQLAGQMQNQQFGQQAQIAAAQNAINQFNTQNANQMGQFNANNNMAAQQYNANQANNAALYNIQNRQGIANQNTQLGNNQQDMRNNLAQQQFGNQMNRAAGQAGVAQQGVNYYQGLGNRDVQKNAGYMNAVIGGGAAGAKYAATPEEEQGAGAAASALA